MGLSGSANGYVSRIDAVVVLVSVHKQRGNVVKRIRRLPVAGPPVSGIDHRSWAVN